LPERIAVRDIPLHPLLRNAHLQTIFPAFMRPAPKLRIEVERLELADGDFVDLGWCGTPAQGAPLAVMVHGLTGSFDSKYLRGLARLLIARGWRIALLQLRGAGPEPNRLSRSYHQGDTADLRYVLRLLRSRQPSTKIAAVGWSLGGNIVLKAMGEEGDDAVVSCVAAACPPFRLHACAERLRQGFSRRYQAQLLLDLKAQLLRKHAMVPAPAGVDIEAALRARDFFEYDDAYTAPLNGFRDAEDYYARSECAPHLRDIRRPTLIVHALDDPFMDQQTIPQAADLAPLVTLELTRGGGHVGFVASGRFGQPVYWLEQRLAAYLCEQLGPNPVSG
jgi:predicted alpha/beta-fold hydrolase